MLFRSYVHFIDFEKAFDSVQRESLWVITEKYWIPEKIIRIVRLFYEDFQCALDDQSKTGEWFNIKTGVKQGCNMSGFMFLLTFIYFHGLKTTKNGWKG